MEMPKTNDFIDIFDIFGMELPKTNVFIDIFDIFGFWDSMVNLEGQPGVRWTIESPKPKISKISMKTLVFGIPIPKISKISMKSLVSGITMLPAQGLAFQIRCRPHRPVACPMDPFFVQVGKKDKLFILILCM